MAKNAHLVLDERATIEVRIRERASFTEIGRELGKDPSTISKEVRLHSQTVRKDSFNPCSKRSTCDEYGTACSKCKLQYSKSCKRCPRVKCYEHCKQFEVLVCNKLKKPPYVCNGCIQRQSCKLEKHIYSDKSAQKNYETTRSESRQRIAITPEELKHVDAIVSPLVKLGQSIHMIRVNNADDIMLDEKTIYNYIDAGLLSVDNIDLPRKVRYRTRAHKKPVKGFQAKQPQTFQNHALTAFSNILPHRLIGRHTNTPEFLPIASGVSLLCRSCSTVKMVQGSIIKYHRSLMQMPAAIFPLRSVG